MSIDFRVETVLPAGTRVVCINDGRSGGVLTYGQEYVILEVIEDSIINSMGIAEQAYYYKVLISKSLGTSHFYASRFAEIRSELPREDFW